MNTLQTEVLVIGGGATGTGIVRDLAMRGFKTILVEKGDLSHGTTGRYHGLLHSGGRYVVKDPQAARECIEENRILRQIMPHCLEDTGGFFVVTPDDDPDYAPRFVQGCHIASIPVEEVPLSQMLRAEPLLNPRISMCFRVPDAAADSFLASELNAQSAREHGGQVLNYHKVLALLRRGDKVVGARCHDLVKDETLEIHADLVVNASGAWAGQIAGLAGLRVHIVPGKGIMIAVNHRIVNTVINRCKLPSDGDILVPIHTVAVIGTTDVKVSDPDHFAIEPWEVRLMLEEGEKLVPGFKDMRMLRAWAGVRPLYQETEIADTRDITRAFVLLDHEKRDGISGLVTITSGKWTTYRKMAEVTVDLVCEQLAVQRPCRTHLETLPGAGKHGYHRMGIRLAEIEKAKSYGQLVCECELATYEHVTQAIVQGQAKTIDDVRRDVRLGMGPCQGGFCTYRVTGLLHALRRPPVQETNVALRDFLQERWKGLLPVLWGQQLRQERLNELIYNSLLNADHLPGPASSRLSPELYLPAEDGQPVRAGARQAVTSAAEGYAPQQVEASAPTARPVLDVLVIGAGMAGLAAAWQAAHAGRKVRVISMGWSSLYWHTGCIDVLGYAPENGEEAVISPAQALAVLIRKSPRHPYALTGLATLEAALEALKELCAQAGYPLHGSLERNWLLPTALGTARPTCLAPETMIAGDMRQPGSMLIIGFDRFLDFYPELIADNLQHQQVSATGMTVEIASLQAQRMITSRVLAESFDKPGFRAEVAAAVKAQIAGMSPERVGFPAVLGLANPLEAQRDLESYLGLPVFEIPTLPPSIAGMRLHNLLVRAIEKLGGRVYEGMQALSADAIGDEITTVWSEAAARKKPHRAASFVLATGGLLGGGIRVDPDGNAREPILGLQLSSLSEASRGVVRQFLGPISHPVFRIGLQVNASFQPIEPGGGRLYRNLYTAGGALAHFDSIQERSLEGVALASGYHIGRQEDL